MSETKSKVLLVDDDAFIRDFLKMLLEYMTFDVSMAENGKKGVEKARENYFDLIVSDIDMPVMSGIELITEIRQFDTEVPIIILTGNDDVSTAIDAMRKGAFDYIFKDDNIQEALPIAVDKAFDKRRLEDENRRLLQDLKKFNEELQDKIAVATAELRDTNQLLNLKVEELNALHDVGQAISSIIPVDKLLEQIMERSKFLMKAEVSSLMRKDEESNELTFLVAQGEGGKELKKGRINIDDNSIAGWVAKHAQPLVIKDVYKDPRFNPDWDKKTGFRTKSMICVPLF